MPITDKQNKGAEEVSSKLKEAGIRVEVNKDNETLGKKIRAAETQKIPYLLVIGDKEIQAEAVAVRQRSKGNMGQIKLEKFINQVSKEIENRLS